MADAPPEVTPDQIAAYDQTRAAVDHRLDGFVAAFVDRSLDSDFHPAVDVCGMGVWLEDNVDREAPCRAAGCCG